MDLKRWSYYLDDYEVLRKEAQKTKEQLPDEKLASLGFYNTQKYVLTKASELKPGVFSNADDLYYPRAYLGAFTIKGEIEGTVPAYIKKAGTKQFIPVVSMNQTFSECYELVTAPVIPDTVEEMENTFKTCVELRKIPNLPINLDKMQHTFLYCEKLMKIPEIPYGVRNMNRAFVECKKIQESPTIPETVVQMNGTFLDCVNLKTAPVIPKSVQNIENLFAGCSSLTGDVYISCSPRYLSNCFFHSTTNENCKVVIHAPKEILEKLIATGKENKNLEKGEYL